MNVAVAGMVLLMAAVGGYLTLRRTQATSWLVLIPASVALVGLAGVGIYLWARTATDTSQLARVIAWGDPDYDDQYRYPVRTIDASPDPLIFEMVEGVAVDGYLDPAHDQPLETFLAENATTAFVVSHRDGILFEAYYNGSDRDTLQTSLSIAKSVIATLVGIALDEGALTSLDDPVTDYVPELVARDPRFGDIALRHLITMSSGLSYEYGRSPWDDRANTYHGTDLRAAVIDTPHIVDPPGSAFQYNDWNVILLGLVLERATGMSVAEYTETRLWQPMGAEANASWSLDSERHGFEKSFVGLNATAMDYARLGRLYLVGGSNGSERVVSPDFIADATRRATGSDPASPYRYLWWIDEDHDAFYARGDYGQYIYVDPGAEIVIVRTADNEDEIDWIAFFADLTAWLEPQLDSR